MTAIVAADLRTEYLFFLSSTTASTVNQTRPGWGRQRRCERVYVSVLRRVG